jgi:Fe-S-cluster containining protein
MSMELPVINNEGNLCLEKCTAACCQDMFINVSVTQLPLFLPKGSNYKEHASHDDIGRVHDDGAAAFPGVYYTRNGINLYRLYISGKCPNLQDDFKCGIHENRPDACRNLEVGGAECTTSRKKFDLPPLFPPEPPPSLYTRTVGYLTQLLKRRFS